MYKILGMTAVAALLAGCADKDEVPEDRVNDVVDVVTGTDDDGDVTTPVTIEDGVITVGGLQAATYDGTELRVQIALDGSDELQAYELISEVRSDDYQKFAIQISELNRAYTAIGGRTPDGELVAVVSMDGGQFNRFFGGGTVIQSAYTKPDGGALSYAGNYAGLVNFGGDVLPVGDAPVGAFSPRAASEVTGQVFFNANFTDNKVEGGMGNRMVTLRLDESTTIDVELAELVFINSDVNQDGTFAASVELTPENDEAAVGSYSGAFGGNGENKAEYLGGIVALSSGFLEGATNLDLVEVPTLLPDESNQAAVDAAIATNTELNALIDVFANGNEREYGIFVIETCGVTAAECASPL